MLRAIIQFELKNNKSDPAWNFRGRGLGRVNDDFYLLQEYLASAFSDQFKQICDRWGKLILSPAELGELDQMPEDQRVEKKLEKLRPHFQPAWSFLVALCHALQEGENELSALDAFWLGLIDEVLGNANLPITRYFAEYQTDPEPETLPEAIGPAAPAGAAAPGLADEHPPILEAPHGPPPEVPQ